MISSRAGLIFVLVGVFAATPTRAADSPTADQLTDEHVRQAIDALVEEIYSRKIGRRFWDPAKWDDGRHGSIYQKGGYTALTTLALLYAGESYQDPRLQGPLEKLATAKLEGTYSVAVRTSIWAKLPPRFAPNLAADTTWLLDGFSADVGGWAYDHRPNTRRRDNSIRQFGALALWESAKRGSEVRPQIWRTLENAFLQNQLPNGGWNYKGEKSEPPSGSMTAAGLATLFITQEQLHTEKSVALSAVNTENQKAIDRGLAWMDANFSPTENPGSFRDFYYYLYGVERVGLASGVKHFGGQDWYRRGAAELLRRLCTWDDAGVVTVNDAVGGPDGNGAAVQIWHLDFALMFLSRGRVPVAVNKLLAAGQPTNNRPRDATNVARWLSDATESEMSWQRVDHDAPPEAWLDAPFVYLASHRAVPWLYEGREPDDSDASTEDNTLKQYLDLGGLLVAVNEGKSRAFSSSMKQLGTLLYPGYAWRTLEDDHWAYTIHAKVKKRKPVLLGLSNGVRELIILAPRGDLAADFQRGPLGKGAAKRTPSFETVSNLYFYASEMNRPRPRLARHAYPRSTESPTGRPIPIVRAKYGGNWNPEPAALDVFGSYLAAEHGLRVDVTQHALDAIHTLDPRPALVLVSGIAKHEFTRAERDAIEFYVDDGGFILFETAGGTGGFTQDAEAMATAVFETPIQSLLRDPVVTGQGIAEAANLFRVEYRPYAFEVFGTRETITRLRGMSIGGAPRVLFSREDMSHALLDQPCWGVSGYDSKSARLLLANLVRRAARPDDATEATE